MATIRFSLNLFGMEPFLQQYWSGSSWIEPSILIRFVSPGGAARKYALDSIEALPRTVNRDETHFELLYIIVPPNHGLHDR
jgi:hypothetical protein